MGTIDLHSHSTMSDGTLTPREIVELAHRQGLWALTITDHDMIDGVPEAAVRAAELGIDFLPGMEMTISYLGRRIHVVALGFDIEHPAFQKYYRGVRAYKEAGIDQVIHSIADYGVPITPELVKQNMRHRYDAFAVMNYLTILYPGEPVQHLWDKFIYPVLDALGYRQDVGPAEAFRAIHEAGGVTSLAHFNKSIGLKGLDRYAQEAAIANLIDFGLDGMELYYPSYSDEDRAFAERLVEKYHLIATGGSDFHGQNRPGTELGTGIGNNLSVPYSLFADIKEVLDSRRAGWI